MGLGKGWGGWVVGGGRGRGEGDGDREGVTG